LTPEEQKRREPKLIFKTADVFSEAAVTILRKAWDEEKTYLLFAFGVNAALATELYLKCLLLIECGQFPKIHNLKSLFGQLARKTRQAIKKKHDKAVAFGMKFRECEVNGEP
jgi:HEPN domain-containing protein